MTTLDLDGVGDIPTWTLGEVNHYLHGLGIPDTLHSARHWYGTNLHAITGDLRLTQEMMGHADPGTTAGYVQYSPARAAEAMEALGGGALRVVPPAVRPQRSSPSISR